MNIYFTASLAAKEKYIQQYKNIINYLQGLGHIVYAQHITEMTEAKVNELSREEILDFHKHLDKRIRNCDFVVADTSFHSVSVGYELSLALWVGKPILIFHDKSGPPSLLRYDKGERITTVEYHSETYKTSITTFITNLTKKVDARFMLMIPPKISLHLEKISINERTPKSVYIRSLIEKDMENRTIQ